MNGCDVFVVGGGPAGSACARKLRRSDLAVREVVAREELRTRHDDEDQPQTSRRAHPRMLSTFASSELD